MNIQGGEAMKRGVVHVVVGVGVAVMAVSCAEQSSVRKPVVPEATVTEKGEIASATEFAGMIGKIDAGKGLITVEHWPLSKTFRVPPECRIDILTNANAVLTQLKVEDAVVVTYSQVGEEFIANRIVRQGKAYDQERKEKLERLDEMLNPSPNQ
jgi:hypothetical protein